MTLPTTRNLTDNGLIGLMCCPWCNHIGGLIIGRDIELSCIHGCCTARFKAPVSLIHCTTCDQYAPATTTLLRLLN